MYVCPSFLFFLTTTHTHTHTPPGNKDAALQVLKNLKVAPEICEIPERTSTLRQPGGWECGLFVLNHMETRLRKEREEPVTMKPSIMEIVRRGNEFIQKIKLATEPGGTRGQKLLPPTTLEDAQNRATECSKCTVKKSGVKGCRQCMGEFFVFVQQRKAASE